MRTRPSVIPLASSTASAARAQRRGVGDRQAQPRRGAAQPSVVAGPRERHPPIDAERLEHPVADEQAVVERRESGLVARRQRSVDPHGRGHRPRGVGRSARRCGRCNARRRARRHDVEGRPAEDLWGLLSRLAAHMKLPRSALRALSGRYLIALSVAVVVMVGGVVAVNAVISSKVAGVKRV